MYAHLFNGPEQRPWYKDAQDFELAIYRQVAPLTLQTPDGIISLVRAVRHTIAEGIPGTFVECGVYRGGGIAAMILAAQTLDRPINVWAYDTFRGFPKPSDEDFEYAKDFALNTWNNAGADADGRGSNWLRCTVDQVRMTLAPLRGESHVAYVEGLVEDTIPATMPPAIAFARFDTDFYASTAHQFQHLWPKIARGGMVFVDDYGCFAGCKKATDEFLATLPSPRPYLHRVDEHVRVLVKP